MGHAVRNTSLLGVASISIVYSELSGGESSSIGQNVGPLFLVRYHNVVFVFPPSQ